MKGHYKSYEHLSLVADGPATTSSTHAALRDLLTIRMGQAVQLRLLVPATSGLRSSARFTHAVTMSAMAVVRRNTTLA